MADEGASGRMSSGQPLWDEQQLRAPHDVPDKAGRVRSMFDAIAPRYELVNRLFSLGIDARWRRRAVRLAEAGPSDEVLDIACGTGDFARAFARTRCRRVVGCDFAHEMLVRARGAGVQGWCEADALRLPFANGAFSVTCCAFGVRNFADLATGFAEMYRVLRPGGRAVILEFSEPRGVVVPAVYRWYSQWFMPRAAAWVSGDRTGAYRYLPRSVVSFAAPAELCATLERVGFTRVRAEPLTAGVVTVYLGRRDR